MINSVRNTVLSILNKNNYGYISPSDFNLFAKQAQLDLFENYFSDFNTQINLENARRSGTGYADLKQQLAEVVDLFTVDEVLPYVALTTDFSLPDNWYTLLDLNYTSPAGSFLTIERVTLSKIKKLLMSNLTAPSTTYPAYVINPKPQAVPAPALSNSVKVYPVSIVSDVSLTYVRYPKDPKWTFATLAGGQPVFDQTQADYQDFELPLSDEPSIVNKILEMAGLSIREMDVVNKAQAAELLNNQTQTS